MCPLVVPWETLRAQAPLEFILIVRFSLELVLVWSAGREQEEGAGSVISQHLIPPFSLVTERVPGRDTYLIPTLKPPT